MKIQNTIFSVIQSSSFVFLAIWALRVENVQDFNGSNQNVRYIDGNYKHILIVYKKSF